ncbi:hypothetical protein NMY22_g17615 [Coprinellus aureogranulatus]|nr:hypothetical protein NMY22_g17615 [Coprinellus aureogranulatus]
MCDRGRYILQFQSQFARDKRPRSLTRGEGLNAVAQHQGTFPSTTMSFFHRAHHFASENNTFISAQNYIQNAASEHKEAFELLRTHISEGAMHNSDERCDPPMCHPETRKAVQDDIFSWIKHGDRDAQPKKILWMSGPAGCGKTAIAGTVAELCEEQGLLAASFFFSSFTGSPSRRDKQYLIPTLAYQLMRFDSSGEMREHILSSIANDPSIFRMRLKEKSRKLLMLPLRALRSQHPFRRSRSVIIIDGLDEVESHHSRRLGRQQAIQQNEVDQVEILSSLIHATNDPSFPFSVVIISRPERGIKGFFSTQLVKDVTLDIFLDNKYDPDSDIELFLNSKFTDIRRHYNLPASWPSQQAIQTLVQKASGQFIYAATVVRFVEDRTNPPPYQLDCVLRLHFSTSEDPLAPLNALYTQILSLSPEPSLAAAWIYNLAYIESPAYFCRQLLERRPGEAEHLLGNLSSLIHTPPSEDRQSQFEIYHKSLADFLDNGGMGFDRRKRFHLKVRSYVTVLENKMPAIPLPDSEWRIFIEELLAQFYRSFIEPTFLDSSTIDCSSNGALTRCDVQWWLRELLERIGAQQGHCEIACLFEAVHTDCGYTQLVCHAACTHWRGNILEFCRSNGWTIPSEQDFTNEKESWRLKMSRESDDGENYDFHKCFRLPGPSIAHLLVGNPDAYEGYADEEGIGEEDTDEEDTDENDTDEEDPPA